jgi:conjugal transfer pilus assembly protein TraU
MKLRYFLASAFFAVASLLTGQTAYAGACEGKFMNPITDICWSCMYPIRLFGSLNLGSGAAEDYDSGFDKAVCLCNSPPRVGVPTSFWEPVYMTDITHTPWCFPNLGGIEMNVGINDGVLGMTNRNPSMARYAASSSTTFRWVHGYTNPLMYVMDVLLDSSCLTKGSLSPAWPTEVDPAYTDWEISTTINPLAFAVANMTAVFAGTADSISALVDFPRRELFWVAGAWGSIYPYTGWVKPHITGEATSRLLSVRLMAWQHEFKGMATHTGPESACSSAGNWQPVMDKRQYKFQRLAPFPQTKKINGNCCDPIGRSTILVEAGTEAPASVFRDFGYMIFRKRDCCSGAWP